MAFLVCSQYITSKIAEKYSKHSQEARLSWLISAQAKYNTSKDINVHIYTVTSLTYRSSRHLYKALMWLVLGLIFQPILFPANIIGFCGCLYYLLKAYEIVSPIEDHENKEEKLKKIQEEIAKIREIKKT